MLKWCVCCADIAGRWCRAQTSGGARAQYIISLSSRPPLSLALSLSPPPRASCLQDLACGLFEGRPKDGEEADDHDGDGDGGEHSADGEMRELHVPTQQTAAVAAARRAGRTLISEMPSADGSGDGDGGDGGDRGDGDGNGGDVGGDDGGDGADEASSTEPQPLPSGSGKAKRARVKR